MKRSAWSVVAIVPLLSSCMFAPRMSAQGVPPPPQQMRLCVKTLSLCETLTWAGDHYDGVSDGDRKPREVFTIGRWGTDTNPRYVELHSSLPGERLDEDAKTHLIGMISPSGDHLDAGVINYTTEFQLTWKPGSASSSAVAFLRAAEAKEAVAARERQRRINGILVPAGAADIFATYPDDVRAILLPEHDLSWKDAMLPCDDEKESKVNGAGSDVNDGILSLEIGRFALRRGEFARGHCWINHSASTAATYQNPRAMVIMGILHFMGWDVPKDEQLGFRYFDGEFQTHDAWALYFVEQCYINGTGVAKNIPRAGQIDSYLMTHDDGQAVFKLIGADDEGVQYRAARIKALMTDHTETAKETCKMVPVAGTGTVRQECTTSPVYDDGKALQNDLDAIDKKYPNQAKPQQ